MAHPGPRFPLFHHLEPGSSALIPPWLKTQLGLPEKTPLLGKRLSSEDISSVARQSRARTFSPPHPVADPERLFDPLEPHPNPTLEKQVNVGVARTEKHKANHHRETAVQVEGSSENPNNLKTDITMLESELMDMNLIKSKKKQKKKRREKASEKASCSAGWELETSEKNRFLAGVQQHFEKSRCTAKAAPHCTSRKVDEQPIPLKKKVSRCAMNNDCDSPIEPQETAPLCWPGKEADGSVEQAVAQTLQKFTELYKMTPSAEMMCEMKRSIMGTIQSECRGQSEATPSKAAGQRPPGRASPFKVSVNMAELDAKPVHDGTPPDLESLRRDFDKCLDTIQVHLDIAGSKLHTLVLEKADQSDHPEKAKVVYDFSRNDSCPKVTYDERSNQKTQTEGVSTSEVSTSMLGHSTVERGVQHSAPVTRSATQINSHEFKVSASTQTQMDLVSELFKDNEFMRDGQKPYSFLWEGQGIDPVSDLKLFIENFVREKMLQVSQSTLLGERSTADVTTAEKTSEPVQTHSGKKNHVVLKLGKARPLRKKCGLARRYSRPGQDTGGADSGRRRLDKETRVLSQLLDGMEDRTWGHLQTMAAAKTPNTLGESTGDDVCIEIEQVTPAEKPDDIVARGNYRGKKSNLEIQVDLTLSDVDRILRRRKRKQELALEASSSTTSGHSYYDPCTLPKFTILGHS